MSTANSTYTQRYSVPSTSHHTLQISEQLAESPYAVLTPLALLRAFSAEQQSILNELDDMAAAMVPGHPQSVNKDLLGRVRCSCGGKCRLPDDMNVIRLRQVQAHRALLEHYDDVQRGIVQRLKSGENGQPTWLRRSTEKKGTDSQWIALNCCVHEMVAEDVIAGEGKRLS